MRSPDGSPTVAEVLWLLVLGGHAVVALALLGGAVVDPGPGTSRGYLTVLGVVFVVATVVTWRRRAHWRVAVLLGLLLAGSNALGFAAGGSLGLMVLLAWLALATVVWERGRRRAHPGR